MACGKKSAGEIVLCSANNFAYLLPGAERVDSLAFVTADLAGLKTSLGHLRTGLSMEPRRDSLDSSWLFMKRKTGTWEGHGPSLDCCSGRKSTLQIGPPTKSALIAAPL